jgi:hypothetical protein
VAGDRGFGLADYKLCFVGRDERVIRRVELDCRDDAHAIEVVGGYAQHSDYAMELRQEARLVKRFEPAPG